MLKPPSGLMNKLVAARALIDEPEKWGQGRPVNHYGQRCLLGALWPEVNWLHGSISAGYYVVDGDSTLGPVVTQAIERLFPRTNAPDDAAPTTSTRIWAFNDRDSTAHADVLALLDELIATVE